MPELKINGRDVSFSPGQTILQVAGDHDVRIPTLCHLPQVEATGLCRICVVEVAGSDRLLPACATPAAENMVIQTDSQRVRTARKTILELLVATGDHSCLLKDIPSEQLSEKRRKMADRPWREHPCQALGDCRFRELLVEYGVPVKDIEPFTDEYPLDDDRPMIVRDFSRCILCGRCVQACNEVQVNRAIRYPRSAGGSSRGIVPAGRLRQVRPLRRMRPGLSRWAPCWRKKPTARSANLEGDRRCAPPAPTAAWAASMLLHVKDGRIVKVTGVEDAAAQPGPSVRQGPLRL